MKKVNNIFKHLFFIIVFATIISGCSNTKNANKDHIINSADVKNMVASQSFVFIPQNVSAMSGRKRNINSGFKISISKDTIVSYLPYFGRGYTAPLSPEEADFDFTSTHFSTTVTPSKRGWNISIKPKDKLYIRELYFRVYDNAFASLNVTSLDRSFISYDGYIEERKPKK